MSRRGSVNTTHNDSFIHSFIHSLTHSLPHIHSYSFNVQVDITQLQTDREARKEDRIIYIYIAVSSN